MRLLFQERNLPEFVILLLCVVFSEGKKHRKQGKDSSSEEAESKSTFITIRIPAHVGKHDKDCFYEGKLHRHDDSWSPGPCIPECRCKHGHVQCSKLECPDLNCETSIKKKWKCCPECLPDSQNGSSCGVWTKGGNSNGGCCKFPFHYRGVKYYTCTYQDHDNPWCSLSADFDRDGVWGECIDKGDSKKALRFNHHKRKKAKYFTLDQNTDNVVSNIANEAANNVSSELAQNVTNPNATVPKANATAAASNVTTEASNATVPAANATQPMPSVALPNDTVAGGSVQPAATNVVVPASSAGSLPANSAGLLPSPASTRPPAATVGGITPTSQSAIPAPSPSAGVPVVPQPSAVVVQPGASVSVVAPVSNQTTPGLGVSVAVTPTSQPVVQPAQSVAPGQSGAVSTPSLGVTYPAGGTPPLAPQPAPQPSQGAQPAQPAVESGTVLYPFPVSQTTINPEQTQAPVAPPGQAVHEVTTTEVNPNHNVTTTEYWFGKANETLNRTGEVANQTVVPMSQAAGAAVGYQTVSDSPNTGMSNQAPYGYQGASSPYQYQSQYQAPYANQQSDSQGGYQSYNTPGSPAGYNAYYNNAAYQQYGASQAQNPSEQQSYYSSQQQYQNPADQGSYYPG